MRNISLTKRQARLLSGCATMSILAAATPVFAQNAETREDDATIIVTGSELQSIAEVQKRRDATVIVDSISQDEIGALPDLTIAESMRRITGVNTIYNDDIGQFASIRGVHPDFVPVTANGLSIATTGDLGEGTRMINLQVIPGVSVRTILAYKTPTPDLDAGALGGLIDLVPVSAFDEGVQTLIATAGISYTSYMDVPDDNSWGDPKDSPIGKSFNAMWTGRFGANDEFGFVLSGIYEDRPRTQSNDAITNRLYYTSTGATTTPEAANWNGFAAPNSLLNHNYTNLFQKYGGTARLEYRPSDNFSTGLYGYAFISDEQETRNTNRLFQLDQPQGLTELTGSMRVRSVDTQWRYNTFERDQAGLQWQADIKPSLRSTLSIKAGYSYARFLTDRPFVTFVYRPNTRVNYDLGNDAQRWTVADYAPYLNAANYLLGETYRDSRAAKEDLFEARVDYAFNSAPTDRGFGFSLGANARRIDLERDIESTNYVTGTLRLTGLATQQEFNYIGYPYPSLWIDGNKFWTETVNSVAVNTAQSASLSRIDDYRYVEDVFAGYAKVSYISDSMNLMAGFRLDHVKADATNAQIISGVLQPNLVTNPSDYTKLLPYSLAVFNVAPAFRIKAAASQTLGRPNPQDIATVESRDPVEFTISRGNPDIRPRVSTNLDLGLEYFFNNGKGLITLTGFYKDIKDDILTVSSEVTIDDNVWTATQPINGEKTKFYGVEFGFVNASFGEVSPVLSRVGASANLIYVEGETAFFFNGERRVRDKMLWQSKFSANAALFYDLGGGSEVRVAMNHKSDYVESFAASPWLDIGIEPFTTVDLTMKYAITPQLQVRLEGRNLFNANRYRTTGPNLEYYRAGLEIGNTWFLRLSYRM
jgi:TonB-dependent receptor